MQSRRLLVALVALSALQAIGQQPSGGRKPPVFSEPEGAARPAPETQPAPVDAPSAAETPPDAVDVLFGRLAKWPDKSAREAAIALSGLPQVESRLIQSLGHNDWRVQAGAASALADMGSQQAVRALAVAIKDPTNGAALSELMLAIVRIDPKNGPKEVLPFLTHQAGRVRMTALKAIPNPLDARYIEDAAQMFTNRNAAVRANAITLFTRIPEAIGREELILALSDPEVTVANPAVRHLAAWGDEAVLKRLAALARDGTLRQVAYALLGLTLAEDSRGIVLAGEGDAVRDRAYAMLHGDDSFYRAAAAIFLSNVAFRTDDSTLRQIADRYLVPILLDAVAGGNFYNDYVAVEDLAYRKLELLSGEAYGQNSMKWRVWWQRSADGFKARRQLRALSAGDLAACTITIRVEEPGGRIRSAALRGETSPLTSSHVFVLGARERDALKAAFEASRFFLGRGDPEGATRARSLTEITVICGEDRFTRRHRDTVPPEIMALADTIFDVARALAWQRFAPADAAARAAYINEQSAFFSTADADSRRTRLLDLALEGYPSFAREGRAAAVELFQLASPEFTARNANRLLELLRSEPALNDESAALIGVLSTVEAVPVREQVLAFLGRAPAARADEVVREFLARQPRHNVMAAMRSEAAVTRVAAAEALARFPQDPDVASVLIEAINDFDPRVREAVITTLAKIEDERVPAMLEAAIAGTDKGMRIRAVEALGPVQKGEAVPRLMEVFRAGDSHERFAVIRSLARVNERRATVALGSIVRECADLPIAGEALNVLARSTEPTAAAEVKEIFEKTRVPDIRLQAIDALATLQGADAVAVLLPSLTAEDADVRRVTLLTLARLGAREALAPLVRALDKPEGDPAAEAAFSRLTFFVSTQKAPAHRALEYQRFAEESGSLSRSEWFTLALRGLSADPALVEGFTLDDAGDARRIDVYLKAVEEGNWALRAEAESRLLAESGLKLEPLSRVATPEDVKDRVAAYRRWQDALKR